MIYIYPCNRRLKECRNCARALATSSSSTNKLDERVGAVQRVVLAAQRAQEADPRVGYAGLVAAEAEREEAVDEGDVFGTLEPDLNQKVASSFIFEEVTILHLSETKCSLVFQFPKHNLFYYFFPLFLLDKYISLEHDVTLFIEDFPEEK